MCCVAWHIHNTKRNYWYVKVILLLACIPTSHAYKIMLSNKMQTFLCLYLTMGSVKRPKLQGISVHVVGKFVSGSVGNKISVCIHIRMGRCCNSCTSIVPFQRMLRVLNQTEILANHRNSFLVKSK